MTKGRLEAFSDGVFAVAITLLVLDIHVPEPHPNGNLGHDLLRTSVWPHYAAYVVSFLTIGIIWINHHVMVRRLRVVDRAIMALNLLLLLLVVLLPFTTSLIATYLTADYGDNLAAAIWAGSFLAMAVGFTSLQHHILFTKHHLLASPLSEAERDAIWRRNSAGLLPYAFATVIALVSAYASVAVCAAVAVFYALPFELETDGESP